ncbi:hypothetical protein HPB48_019890 [Haemaphysalis longicornis]|uniref:Uncharacterized protein n=1 Tax=Haemaphysalis longicornis TaxID=44386 RepID=A0A9J6GXL4_HAELO|nr:hypothetical protein HPB48_019890 [Haemaphysalis longicornis]
MGFLSSQTRSTLCVRRPPVCRGRPPRTPVCRPRRSLLSKTRCLRCAPSWGGESQNTPSRTGYGRQSDGSWFDQGPSSPWILAKTSARPRMPRRLFPCCRPQQTWPPPLKSARVTRADLCVKWPSERIPAQQSPVFPVDPPGKPCLCRACTLTPLCTTFSGLSTLL